jgi:KRAB domain-containing zinc finger protein
LQIHKQYREKKFICEVCSNQFFTRTAYRNHVEKTHERKNLIYCQFCGRAFQNKNSADAHIRLHKGERSFQCEQCPRGYYSKGELKTHVMRHHSTKTIPCNECNEILKSKFHLRNHMRSAHSERKFVCEYEGCGKRFIQKYVLKEHVNNVHLQIKSHVCQTCGTSFSQKYKLNRHILNTHMNLKFPCEVFNCSSQFARKETLRAHVKSHHSNLGEEAVQKLMENVKKLEYPKIEDYKNYKDGNV